jgi:hypothetical protein
VQTEVKECSAQRESALNLDKLEQVFYIKASPFLECFVAPVLPAVELLEEQTTGGFHEPFEANQF